MATIESINNLIKADDSRDPIEYREVIYSSWLKERKTTYYVDTEDFLQPLQSLVECKILKTTLEHLEIPADVFSNGQLGALTYIHNGRNTVLIDPRRSLKTGSYVLYLITMLHKETLMNTKHVRAVIICSDLETCTFVNNMFKIMLGTCDGVKCFVAATDGEDDARKIRDIINGGYNILICTPFFLKKFIKKVQNSFIDNLMYVIFEDMEILIKRFDKVMTKVYTILIHQCYRRGKEFQTIILWNYWYQKLRDWMNFFKLKNIAYVVTDALETVIYCAVECEIIVMSNCNHLELVLDVVVALSKHNTTAVVCTTDNEAGHLYSFFSSSHLVKPHLVTPSSEGISKAEIEVYSRRLRRQRPIILCTDELLDQIKYFAFEYIVMVTVPKDHDKFVDRFSLLNHHLMNYVTPTVKVFFLINEENRPAIPKVCKIPKRINVPMLPMLVDEMKAIKKMVKYEKKGAKLCLDFLRFGRCSNKTCSYRHNIVKIDKPLRFIPSAEHYVKLEITDVYSINHYSGIITAVRIGNEWRKLDTDNPKLDGLLCNYSKPQNGKSIKRAEIGDIVAFEKTAGNYVPVKILEPKYDEQLKRTNVIISFLECENNIMDVPMSELYPLSEKLQKQARGKTVDVILCSLRPKYRNKEWVSGANALVRKEFKRWFETDDQCYIEALIHLVVKQCILVDARYRGIDQLIELDTALNERELTVDDNEYMNTVLSNYYTNRSP